ncbi:MAG: hypothetical protein Q9160_004968 [Pyrenula sp. 1 TL-2023]
MSPPKPTLLFIHGAWHNPHCWASICQELESLGYPTAASSLISMGRENPAVQSHLADVAVVRKDLESLIGDGKDVILVMHSYGGMAGGGAIEGLEVGRSDGAKGGVRAAVFLAAFLTPKGKSLLGMFTDGTPEYLAPCPDDPSFLIIKDPHQTFYNDLTEEESEPWTSTMRPQAAAIFASEVESVAWEHVPCTYIFCEKDQGVYPPVQEMMIEGAKATSKYPWRVVRLANSHSAWLSNAAAVVRVIREAAGEEKV